jgi:hypothetical protein
VRAKKHIYAMQVCPSLSDYNRYAGGLIDLHPLGSAFLSSFAQKVGPSGVPARGDGSQHTR